MMDETKPNDLNDMQPRKAGKPSRMGLLISLLVLMAALGLGATAGYSEGVYERVNAKSTLVAQQMGDQIALVDQDIAEGRYAVARQRLEFILQQDPGFPGASAKLAQVLVQQAITPSPVPTATPTITPTPDLRSQEAIFAQAQQQLLARDWTALMGSLDSLRKADPAYKAVDVDGMYYTALRNRGMDQISGSGAYKITNMEGGIYDLTLAERFGPLDGQADGLRNAARMYIVAASFWSVDWSRAVSLFREVYQYYPNLRDASYVTSGQRLREALLNYGDQLASVGSERDRCQALDIWNEANALTALDGDYAYKYNHLYLACNPPTEVPAVVVPTLDPNAPTPDPNVPTVDPNIPPEELPSATPQS